MQSPPFHFMGTVYVKLKADWLYNPTTACTQMHLHIKIPLKTPDFKF